MDNPHADRRGVKTITRGRITAVDDVNTVLAAGRADLCVMDPEVLELPASRP